MKYFTIMARQSFGNEYSGGSAFAAMRKAGTTVLVLQVPWDMMIAHERQAQINHSQTIAGLHSRGGLEASEAVAVLLDRRWHKMEYEQANRELLSVLMEWEASH